MINEWLVRFAPWILGLIGLGFILMVWRALRAFQVSRTGPYYAIREEARQRGFRLSAVAVSILVVGLALGLCVQALSQRTSPPLVATRLSAPLTLTVATSLATLVPTGTPSPLPTASPTPLPPSATPTLTRIPLADLPPTILTPLPAAVAAAPNAQLGPITFAPPSPEGDCLLDLAGAGTTQFEVGTAKICAYFPVHNMKLNTPWTAAWYKEGKYVDSSTLLWDGPAGGIGKAFYAAPGRQPGQWELRLYIEDRLQTSRAFSVSALTASPTPAAP